ncbi:sulfate ABC transporter substrate-binding protein [Bacillus safensis]|uniref:sulfate ABC transporter substrate-binding protein n=1 Tax=Bacillus safensis TaxID=561879 RepID=UPI003818AA4D
MKKWKWVSIVTIILVLAVTSTACSNANEASKQKGKVELLNVSYDPTRELYQEYNQAFQTYWKDKTGEVVTIKQSHGGSGKQGRSIIDGLEADVATLALGYDIDAIADRGLLSKDWQKEFPNQSTPYTSTIVFLVKKGNPKNIKDWNDLVRPGVSIITPNPKTSGGARWNYLAAWAYADKTFHGNEEKTKDFVKKLYEHVEVLDSGARGATTTFVERGLGDVLIAWENEAYLTQQELGKDKFEIVTPSISILAEPPVAVVDQNVKRKGTEKVAKAYLDYLYSKKGQEIAAKNYYRPRNQEVLNKYKDQFKEIDMVTIDQAFGGWRKAQKRFFDDGGLFDQIYSGQK